QLGWWAAITLDDWWHTDFLRLVWNSLGLAATAALIAVLLAVFMAYGKRMRSSFMVTAAVRLAGMGYAIPGTVIAVGVMLPFAWIDNGIDGWMREHFGVSTGL